MDKRNTALAKIQVAQITEGDAEEKLRLLNTPRPTKRTAERYIPPAILDAFVAAYEDPGLLDLSWEIAYTEAKMTELMQMFEESRTTPAVWDDARELCRDAVSGSKSAGQSLTQLLELLESGCAENKCQASIYELIEQRRRLAESQLKKTRALDQFITKKQATALGAALMSILRRHIRDDRVRELALAEVAFEFRRAPIRK